MDEASIASAAHVTERGERGHRLVASVKTPGQRWVPKQSPKDLRGSVYRAGG